MRHAIRLNEHNPVKLDLNWNLLDNSKSVKNQKKLQLQMLFQITPSFSTNFLKIFITPWLFFPHWKSFQNYFYSGISVVRGHLLVSFPRRGPRVRTLSPPGHDRTDIANLSAFEIRLDTAADTRNDASKTMCKIDNKNRMEEQFVSSQVFHRTTGRRVREITAREQFETRILESFDPVTQELY
jgi:hypothetical protein